MGLISAEFASGLEDFNILCNSELIFRLRFTGSVTMNFVYSFSRESTDIVPPI